MFLLTVSGRILIATIFVLFSFGPIKAFANGGPVDWTEGTPQGGLALKQETKVRLMTEDLSIKLDKDLDHYQVTAVYWLNNTGASTDVNFGVPMQWGGKRTPPIVAEDISFEIGANRISCQPDEVKTAPISEENDDGSEQVPTGSAWCIGTFSIPTGPEIALKMMYRAELQFEDLIYSKSAFKVFGHRTLKYPLFPAGYWAGKVERVSARIDLGPYRPRDLLKFPRGAEISGSKIRWELKDVDLKHAPDLEVELDGSAMLHTREIATWNAKAPDYARLPLRARASSTLSGDATASFDVKYLLDGRSDTAWCSSDSGDNDWVEISIPKSDAYRLEERWGSDQAGPESHTHLEAIGVVPGLAAGSNAYQEYGRPQKLLISRCGTKPDNPLGEIDFDSSTQFDESAITLPKDSRDYFDPSWEVRKSLDADAANGKDPCLRFTITGTTAGRLPHTCISEITLILNGG